jgi:hypothetical protein
LLYRKLIQSKEKMMSLPQLLPLPEAARELGLTEAELRARVDAGTIAAGRLPDGEIVVSKDNLETNSATDINTRLRAIKREDFEHLRGQAITVTEAAKKYSKKHGIKIIQRTINVWANRGYVRVITPGYKKVLDEADIAYCAAIHAVRKLAGIRTGFPLLDKDGRPGLLQHPDLSRYRRERREKG